MRRNAPSPGVTTRRAGTATAPMAGARPTCRWPRLRRPPARRPEAPLLRLPDRLGVAAEPRLEPRRRLAGIAHGALRALEGLRHEGEALLQISALRRRVAGCVRRDRIHLLGGARGDVGELVLTMSQHLQPRDELAALAVGFGEKAGEEQRREALFLLGRGDAAKQLG